MIAIVPPSEHDPELLPAGTAVGEYVLDDLLGAGGFARVYRAHHAVLPTKVAIKVITRALALDAEASRRFLGEALAASRIDHPGVVRVIGYGKLSDDRAYLVMELIEGPALDEHLEKHGRLARAEALRMLDAIAVALDAAHASGIVHRDLKPANVLLAPGPDGPVPRLADFGIAKAFADDENPHLTRTGTTLGTPTYMSPEQALGRRTGPPSDVYSFGVVAYELLTGRVPFEGESPLETMMMHVQAPPPPASSVVEGLNEAFDAPLAQLLAKAAEDRPTTLAAAMAMLANADAARPVTARRGRAWLIGAAALVGALLIAAVAWSRTADEPRPRSQPTPDRPAAATPAAAPVTNAAAARPDAGVEPARPEPRTEPSPPPKRAGRRAAPKDTGAPASTPETSGSVEPSDELETPPDYTP